MGKEEYDEKQSKVTQHISRGDSGKMEGIYNMCALEIDRGGMAAYKEEEQQEEGIALGIKEEEEEEEKEKEKNAGAECSRGILFDLEKQPLEIDHGGMVDEKEEERLPKEEEDGDVMGMAKGLLMETKMEKGKGKRMEKEKEKKEEAQTQWDDTVLETLHIVRRHQLSELDPRNDYGLPTFTRFCHHNIALFDLNKESKFGLGPPVDSVTSFDNYGGDDSINVISIRIVESEVEYPFRIFGTVLARDEVDYRCVYFYKRDRNNPQEITSSEDNLLTLTGPNRGIGMMDFMYFEIDLKIIKEGVDVVEPFSKGVVVHNNVTQIGEDNTRTLKSWKSTLDLLYTIVHAALEATIAVNVLKKPHSTFNALISAYTSGNDKYDIILYDTEVENTPEALGDGGSVQLTRRLVVVSVDEDLVINVSVFHGDLRVEVFEFVMKRTDRECIIEQNEYKLQVKVTWTCRQGRREKTWQRIGHTVLLL